MREENGRQYISDRQRLRGHHRRMDRAHRAKQFAPFAALKGFEECVHRKENVYEAKAELPQEQIEEIKQTLRMAEQGQNVKIIYFCECEADRTKGQYQEMTGQLEKIDPRDGVRIKGVKINFADIKDVSIL